MKLIKRKNGFTLVELMATIVIIAIITVVAITTLVINTKKAKEEASNISSAVLKKCVYSYIVENKKDFYTGNKDSNGLYRMYKDSSLTNVLLKDLADQNYIDVSKYTDEELNIEIAVYRDDFYKYYYIFLIGEQVVTNLPAGAIPDNPADAIPANPSDAIPDNPIDEEPDSNEIDKPILDKLVPIKYENNKWIVTTKNDPNWYNYSNQKWANAALMTDESFNKPGTELILPDDDGTVNTYAMFVWIPRFSYTIGCQGNSISQAACLGYKTQDASELTVSTPGAIDIKFTSTDVIDVLAAGVERPAYNYSSSDTEEQRLEKVTNWMTHPAFWWDKNGNGKRESGEELSGIWVGKFETSDDPNDTCYKSKQDVSCQYYIVSPRILPNLLSLTYQKVYDQYQTARNFGRNGNIFGIDSSTFDVHMMKNSEWGAVAYLSQSKYGKYGNPNYKGASKEIYKNDSSSIYTGRSEGTAPVKSAYSKSGTYKYDDTNINTGLKEEYKGTGASTTGNIYGVYDMSGGANEYVMGNCSGSPSSSKFSSSWFTDSSHKMYFDNYTRDIISTLTSEILGHGLYETKSWYEDTGYFISQAYPWLSRGGAYGGQKNIGIFESAKNEGSYSFAFSFRISASSIN